MLQVIPQLGTTRPVLVATFKCFTPIVVQVITPNTLYLAETDNALSQADDSGTIDALQVNQASGILPLWWIGDLWAAGSASFRAIIGIPGVRSGSGLAGQAVTDPSNVLTTHTGGTL